MRHNVGRAAAGAELDVGYLRGLSDDAVPALGDAGLVAAIRCGDDVRGAGALNAAARRAVEICRRLCPN